MTRRTRTFTAAWSLVIAAGLLGPGMAARGAEEKPSGEVARWLTTDTVIYLEVNHTDRLIERLSDPRVLKPLQAVPSIRQAGERADLARLWNAVGVIAERLGSTPSQALADLTAGGIVFAVEAPAGGSPHGYVVVTPSDPARLTRAHEILLELAREDAVKEGRPEPVKEGEYRGVTGYQAHDKVAHAILNGRLVIVDRPDTAKALIDRVLDGPGASEVLADSALWKERKAAAGADAVAWGLARLDQLRELDPRRFGGGDEKPRPNQTLLLGGWIEVFRKSPLASAVLNWTGERLAGELTLATPREGIDAAFQGFAPGEGAGAPALATPSGTIASMSLWRDLAALWNSRADLFRPEDVQNLAKLDTFAGQFFGGRDFGADVLGAIGTNWRLVIANQDHAALKPAPDVKLPAFALVMDIKPDNDGDFAERLKVAFQSFIGVSNLSNVQKKAPPLELGSETFEGVDITTSRFMPPRHSQADGDTPPSVDTRYNFSPSAALVDNHFILSTSLGLTRDLIRSLRSPSPGATDGTFVTEADGAALAQLLSLNRERLVMRNMLEKGHEKEQAEAEVALLGALIRYLGRGRLAIQDRPDATRLRIEFQLGK